MMADALSLKIVSESRRSVNIVIMEKKMGGFVLTDAHSTSNNCGPRYRLKVKCN